MKKKRAIITVIVGIAILAMIFLSIIFLKGKQINVAKYSKEDIIMVEDDEEGQNIEEEVEEVEAEEETSEENSISNESDDSGSSNSSNSSNSNSSSSSGSNNSSSSSNNSTNNNSSNVSDSENNNSGSTYTCTPKKFYLSFTADFESMETCQSIGQQYIDQGLYRGYMCYYATDDCGDLYYMLKLLDENGNYINYSDIG